MSYEQFEEAMAVCQQGGTVELEEVNGSTERSDFYRCVQYIPEEYGGHLFFANQKDNSIHCFYQDGDDPEWIRRVENDFKVTGVVKYSQGQYLTDAQKQQARTNIGAAGSDAVLYDQAQTLTDAQKQQARTNIGAAGSDAVLYGQSQTLTSAQKQQARTNIGALEPTVVAVTSLDSMTYYEVSAVSTAVNKGNPCVVKVGSNTYHTAIASRFIAGAVEAYLLSPMDGTLHRIHYNINSSRYTHEVFPLGKHSVVYNEAQTLTDTQKQQARTNIGAGTSNLEDAPSDGTQYARCDGEWVEVEGGGGEAVQSDWNETDSTDPAFIKNKPTIPQPENHQIVRNALASSQTFDANEWAEVCRIVIPEDGAYQISSLVKPVKVGTVDGTTINVALRQKRNSDVTELAEIELQPNRVTGCMARAINALRGDILVIESYSTVQYGIQAQPSAGKAHATYLEAVRIGAIYQE